MEFSDLNLPEPIMAGIRDCGFTTCTPIQAVTLPLAIAGKDVAGQAQTGTGKTAAFLVALFNRLLLSDKRPPKKAGRSAPRGLIIAPTRELTVQIENDAKSIGAHCGLKIVAVYGGVDYDKQRELLVAGDVDLLIGTPGRLIDYFKQHFYSCNYVESLVIDEADRMFDMGFIVDLRYLMRHLPSYEHRLSMLFSATLSYRSQELSYEFMNHPEIVVIKNETRTAKEVTQQLYHIESSRKISLLVGLLRSLLDVTPNADGSYDALPSCSSADEVEVTTVADSVVTADESVVEMADADETDPVPIMGKSHAPMETRVIIFINTKRMGEKLGDWLPANGIPCGYLSGDVPQSKRLKVLQRFQAGEMPVLIATDVAGRGLHINDVSHVINYDLPENAEDYVHRIGRTARAGARGDAITLVDESGAYNLEAIEKYIGMKIPITWADDNQFVRLKRPEGVEKRFRSGVAEASTGRSSPGGSRGGKAPPPRRSHSHDSTRSTPAIAATPKPQTEEPVSVSAAPVENGASAPPRRRRRRPVGAASALPAAGASTSAPVEHTEQSDPAAPARKRRRRRKPKSAESGAASAPSDTQT